MSNGQNRIGSERRRVALLLPGFCASESDPCIPVITQFAREMQEYIDLSIYTAGYPFNGARYHVGQIAICCTGRAGQSRPEKLAAWRRVMNAVINDHRETPFSVIHAFWGTMPGFTAVRIADRLAIPSLLSLAGGELANLKEEGYGSQLGLYSRMLVRSSLERAGAITAGSEWLARLVPDRFHSRLRTIPLGIDTDIFVPRDTERSGKGNRIIAVGALIPVKDYSTMIRGVAVATSSLPDIHLTIAGWDGNHTEVRNVRGLARELGISEQIHIAGDIPHDEMPHLYHTHDLLLHTSRYEAQGMGILEGLACGLPAIATNVGIAAQLPTELITRIEPGDWKELGRRIVEAFTSGSKGPKEQRAGGQSRVDYVHEHFSKEKMTASFLSLYEELAEHSSAKLNENRSCDEEQKGESANSAFKNRRVQTEPFTDRDRTIS